MSFAHLGNMPGGNFGYASVMDTHQIYARDDVGPPMDMINVWDSSMVDPSQSQRVPNACLPYYHHDWSEQEQQQPMQRYLVESQKMFFTAGQLPSFQVQAMPMDFNKPYDAPEPIPRACEPSHGSPSSICSSATEGDWMHDKFHARQYPEDCAMSPPQSQMFLDRPDFSWSCTSMPQNRIPMIGHINMREVQSYPDPEEVTFQEDEGIMDMETKLDFGPEAESHISKPEVCQGHYHHMSDEGIGRESLNSNSPEPMDTNPTVHEVDIDAEGEEVDEMDDEVNDVEGPVADEEEEDHDTEYKPKASSSRTKSRRSTRASFSSPANKRNKVTKSSKSNSNGNAKSKLQCKNCGDSFRHHSDLLKHTTSVHTRPYICTFSFAGCQAVFGNKNEWKRHVASQHLALKFWICKVGSCASSTAAASSSSSSSKNASPTSSTSSTSAASLNNFNRKDLFTQHLRRMHTNLSLESQRKHKNADWETQIRQLQESGLRIRRAPPSRTRCPVRSCAQLFEGASSWDDRMEHVARHLEKMAPSSSGKNGDVGQGRATMVTVQEVVEQESDEFMIEWALEEGIIERLPKGGYRLWKERRGGGAAAAAGTATEESDANGDEE